MIEIQLSIPGRSPRTRRLAPGDYTIGRSLGCDIRLRHRSVARRHARLSICESESDISISHLEGAGLLRRKGGGTLTRATVHSGDVFEIGECELKVASGWTMVLAAAAPPLSPPVRQRSAQPLRPVPTAGPPVKIVAVQTEDGRLLANRVAMPWPPQPHTGRSLYRRSLGAGEGLLCRDSGVTHTIGAQHATDLIFLDAQLKVLALVPAVAPWRIRLAPRGTRFVLRLRGGSSASAGLRVATYLRLRFESDAAAPSNRLPTCHAGPSTAGCGRAALFSLQLPLAHRHREANARSSSSTK